MGSLPEGGPMSFGVPENPTDNAAQVSFFRLRLCHGILCLLDHLGGSTGGPRFLLKKSATNKNPKPLPVDS